MWAPGKSDQIRSDQKLQSYESSAGKAHTQVGTWSLRKSLRWEAMGTLILNMQAGPNAQAVLRHAQGLTYKLPPECPTAH